jgi:hypothetical protein
MGKDLTQRIRPALLKTVLGNPEMSNEDIDEEIEVLVDRHKQEFLDD